LICCPVAQIEEQIETLLDQSFHMRDTLVFPDQSGHVPVSFRQKGTRIAGPIIVREWICVEILCGQQADTHRDLLSLASVAGMYQ